MQIHEIKRKFSKERSHREASSLTVGSSHPSSLLTMDGGYKGLTKTLLEEFIFDMITPVVVCTGCPSSENYGTSSTSTELHSTP